MFKQVLIIGILMFVAASPVHADLQVRIDDPTRPPGLDALPPSTISSVKEAPRWVLSSILVSPERRTAVVNDRVVAVGDRVSGAVVIEIEPATVRLRSNAGDLTLILLKKNVKTLSKLPSSQQGD
ncbi:MAG TPA: hypothetical protein VIM41_04690 [Gammaproteobacteria bacterium]